MDNSLQCRWKCCSVTLSRIKKGPTFKIEPTNSLLHPSSARESPFFGMLSSTVFAANLNAVIEVPLVSWRMGSVQVCLTSYVHLFLKSQSPANHPSFRQLNNFTINMALQERTLKSVINDTSKSPNTSLEDKEEARPTHTSNSDRTITVNHFYHQTQSIMTSTASCPGQASKRDAKPLDTNSKTFVSCFLVVGSCSW